LELGNDKFKKLPNNGNLVKRLISINFPDRIPPKIKIPSDVKSVWGFTAEEAVDALKKLEETYNALEDKKLGKKPSLNHLAELLGCQHSLTGEVLNNLY